MKNLLKHLILFLIGGMIYYIIEILYRGYSHTTMFLVGGMCFILIGLINEVFNYDMSIIHQGIIGCITVTFLELVAGLILNKILNLNIWDYSNVTFNFMGQICLRFSLAWFFLSVEAIVLDDYIRYILFKEEKPRYRL